MKKLLFVLSLTLGLGFASAQATARQSPPPPPPAKSQKNVTSAKSAKIEAPKANAAIKTKKDGTPDKRYKANQNLKKDGTVDKRYKKK